MNDQVIKQSVVEESLRRVKKSQNGNGFKVKLNHYKAREADVNAALNRLENFYFTSEHAEDIKKKKDVKTRFHIISDKIEEQQNKSDRRDMMLDEVLFLLENARFNSNDAVAIKKSRKMKALAMFAAAILVMVSAVLLIVVDPPGWLKGPTLLYFNPHDGVTVSDVIAILLIGLSTFMMFFGFAGLRRR